jgi:hypothetical protein
MLQVAEGVILAKGRYVTVDELRHWRRYYRP